MEVRGAGAGVANGSNSEISVAGPGLAVGVEDEAGVSEGIDLESWLCAGAPGVSTLD